MKVHVFKFIFSLPGLNKVCFICLFLFIYLLLLRLYDLRLYLVIYLRTLLKHAEHFILKICLVRNYN